MALHVHVLIYKDVSIAVAVAMMSLNYHLCLGLFISRHAFLRDYLSTAPLITDSFRLQHKAMADDAMIALEPALVKAEDTGCTIENDHSFQLHRRFLKDRCNQPTSSTAIFICKSKRLTQRQFHNMLCEKLLAVQSERVKMKHRAMDAVIKGNRPQEDIPQEYAGASSGWILESSRGILNSSFEQKRKQRVENYLRMQQNYKSQLSERESQCEAAAVALFHGMSLQGP